MHQHPLPYLTSSQVVEAPAAQQQAITCRLAHRGCRKGAWSGVMSCVALQSSCLTKVAAGTHSTLQLEAVAAHQAGCGRWVKSVAVSSSSLALTSIYTPHCEQCLARLDAGCEETLYIPFNSISGEVPCMCPLDGPPAPLCTNPTPNEWPQSHIPFAQVVMLVKNRRKNK